MSRQPSALKEKSSLCRDETSLILCLFIYTFVVIWNLVAACFACSTSAIMFFFAVHAIAPTSTTRLLTLTYFLTELKYLICSKLLHCSNEYHWLNEACRTLLIHAPSHHDVNAPFTPNSSLPQPLPLPKHDRRQNPELHLYPLRP